jgi:hypothetical protein
MLMKRKDKCVERNAGKIMSYEGSGGKIGSWVHWLIRGLVLDGPMSR